MSLTCLWHDVFDSASWLPRPLQSLPRPPWFALLWYLLVSWEDFGNQKSSWSSQKKYEACFLTLRRGGLWKVNSPCFCLGLLGVNLPVMGRVSFNLSNCCDTLKSHRTIWNLCSRTALRNRPCLPSCWIAAADSQSPAHLYQRPWKPKPLQTRLLDLLWLLFLIYFWWAGLVPDAATERVSLTLIFNFKPQAQHPSPRVICGIQFCQSKVFPLKTAHERMQRLS